jgi:outer membrane protein TolC
MKRILISAVVALGIGTNTLSAETINVELNTLVKEAIKRNSNMIFNRIQTDIIENQVSYEKNIFIPQVYSSFTHQVTNVPNNTEETLSRGYLETYKERTNVAEVGLKGILPSGGTWQSAFKNSSKNSTLIEQYKDYDSEYTNTFELTLTQHIMKGFGNDVTMSKYHLAKADQNIFNKQSEKKMLDLIGNVIQIYWRMYGIQELKKSYEKAIALKLKSVKLLKQKFKNGEISKNELLQIMSSLMSKQAELKKVSSDLVSTKSNMLNLLNVPEYENSDVEFDLVEKPVDTKSINMSAKEYYEKALENWPEYKMAEEKLRKENLNVKFTKDSVRPTLDFSTKISNTNLDSHRHYDYDEDKFVSWQVGLLFSMPILDTQSKSAVSMAKLKRNQVTVEIDTLKKRLYNAINDKFVSYKNSKEQVEFYTEGVEIKEELLHNLTVGFELGNSSIKDLLDQENDIIEYKRKLFGSIIDWKLSEASLQKAVGELFEQYVDIEEVKNYKVNEHSNRLTSENFGKF